MMDGRGTAVDAADGVDGGWTVRTAWTAEGRLVDLGCVFVVRFTLFYC